MQSHGRRGPPRFQPKRVSRQTLLVCCHFFLDNASIRFVSKQYNCPFFSSSYYPRQNKCNHTVTSAEFSGLAHLGGFPRTCPSWLTADSRVHTRPGEPAWPGSRWTLSETSSSSQHLLERDLKPPRHTGHQVKTFVLSIFLKKKKGGKKMHPAKSYNRCPRVTAS